MKILYFTATGNSLYIAKALGGELYSIPKMVKENKYEFTDEKIGIIFPLYAWSVPSYVVEFLKKSTFNCDYLFAIVTYGMYSAGVTSHILDIAKEAGHNFSYINKIRMVDNYVLGFDMEKQVKNEHKKQIEQNLKVIKSDIESSKNQIKKDFFLNRVATRRMVKWTTKLPNGKTSKLDMIGNGIEDRYYVDDTCTQCKTCSKVCPINNIEMNHEDGKISLNGYCMMCFACIHNCPSNAIHVKGEVSKNRFRNSNVKLVEIIEANN